MYGDPAEKLPAISVTCVRADKRTSSPGRAEEEAQAERVLFNAFNPPDSTSLAVVQRTYALKA